jgi:creatinine amidohydrolase/Fe(II)-dependent formamide hydrolase-like protein
MMKTAENMPQLSIQDFQCQEQLTVGPVHLEARRLSMPYTILKADGQSDSKELIYSYDEEVFDPHDPKDQNLGSLIGAQLALNYGLFFKKIVFNGLFNGVDKRFLISMMENTSKEIYVNKLLQPNPFLTEAFKGLPPIRRKTYTQADISFINTAFQQKVPEHIFWNTNSQKHCVLSSGGKDSLLSYGLLKEIGKEVHPIFGNESGRHWFTALNGYRYQKETDAHTTKVWMNSDRLFAWMLRHLPFIRPDFSHIRADDYPVRLWTVAVFLFGVLPLMKKRELGRLIIGDEYDATQREVFEGITHYNGLYDQSKYFDEAMSRFFLKKGWDISQFSLLRPLSELLIQKILSHRYPELQAHQVSCHATHEKDGRIYPCGKCEKCRRIIGMLSALDVAPRHCGYTDEQVKEGLKSLNQQKLKQIGTDASHLYYLLEEKGLIDTEGGKSHKAYPQIMHLRFDRERSPLHNMPIDLRAPLFKIFLEYAMGSVLLKDRKWSPIDILRHPLLQVPYPFEFRAAPKTTASTPIHKHLWAELTWEEAEEKCKEVDLAILPVGAIEQHGPHLPLDVDAFDAYYLAQKVAEACSYPHPLVLPLISYGVSYHHSQFKGTISVTNEAMSKFIYDIGMSLAQNGIKKILILNGHGDNSPALNYAAQMINRDAHIFVCVDTGETSDADIYDLIHTHNDIHAGEVETSTTLAVRPQLVKMDKAKDMTLNFSNRYLDFTSQYSVPWYAHTDKISANGVMGDPTKASAEKGEKIWKIMISHLVVLVEELKRLSLDEIYQKKF